MKDKPAGQESDFFWANMDQMADYRTWPRYYDLISDSNLDSHSADAGFVTCLAFGEVTGKNTF